MHGRMAVIPQGDVIEGKGGRHDAPIAHAAAIQSREARPLAQKRRATTPLQAARPCLIGGSLEDLGFPFDIVIIWPRFQRTAPTTNRIRCNIRSVARWLKMVVLPSLGNPASNEIDRGTKAFPLILPSVML